MRERPEVAAVITDIRIPFWSMVILLVKWALAAIPALLILGFAGALTVALLNNAGALVDAVMALIAPA